MKHSRRDFFKKGATALAALSVASSGSLKLFSKKPEKASKSLSILIIIIKPFLTLFQSATCRSVSASKKIKKQ